MGWKQQIIEIGSVIMLKRYAPYSDYERHKNERAVIIEPVNERLFDWRVKWLSDQDTSLVKNNNIKGVW